MPTLDLTLSLVFGTLFLAGLAGAAWCFRKSLRVSNQRDGDLKMFFWAMGGLAGLILAGMSAAYILIPIIIHHL